MNQEQLDSEIITVNLKAEKKFNFIIIRTAELASYVNQKGLLKLAPSDSPRIDHDPNPESQDSEGNHKCLGLLLEPSSTNRLLHSTNLIHPSWINAHLIDHEVQNDVISPEGTSGEGKVISITDLPGRDFHLIKQNISNPTLEDRTASVFVKRIENAGSKDFAIWGFGGLQIAVFSRENWSFISGVALRTSVEFYRNAWVRLSATYRATNNDIYFGSSQDSSSQYEGENKKQFYIYGPQLENLSQATSYIPTSDRVEKRGGDILFSSHFHYNGYLPKTKQQHIKLDTKSFHKKFQSIDSDENYNQLWTEAIATLSNEVAKLYKIVSDAFVAEKEDEKPSITPNQLRNKPQNLENQLDKIIVVDVGAKGGINPRWNPVFGENNIDIDFYLVEPDPLSYNSLCSLYPSLKCVPYALGDANKDAVIYLTKDRSCSSLRQPNFEVLKPYPVKDIFQVDKQQIVKCYRYDDLVKNNQAPIPDFVKIDVQGFEYEVLTGFGDILNQVIAIELESHFYPIYEGQKLAVEVIQLLANYGLFLRNLQPHGPFEGELVEANFFFTRRKAYLTQAEVQKLLLWENLFDIPRGCYLSDLLARNKKTSS